MSSAAPVLAGPHLGLASQPAYAVLAQFPAVCFVGTLLSDVAYWQTTNWIWATFSVWLVAAGCIAGAFAAVAALLTWFRYRHVRALPYAGAHALTCALVLVLAIVNAFVHSRDAWVSVVPQGLALSVIVVLLMILATWLGWPRPVYASETGGVR